MKNNRSLNKLAHWLLSLNPQRVAPAAEKTEEDHYETLREWRNGKASAAGVSRYRILSNRTLRHLAQARPTDFDELQEVRGIGPKSLEKYGEEILRALGTEIPVTHLKEEAVPESR